MSLVLPHVPAGRAPTKGRAAGRTGRAVRCRAACVLEVVLLSQFCWNTKICVQLTTPECMRGAISRSVLL